MNKILKQIEEEKRKKLEVASEIRSVMQSMGPEGSAAAKSYYST